MKLTYTLPLLFVTILTSHSYAQTSTPTTSVAKQCEDAGLTEMGCKIYKRGLRHRENALLCQMELLTCRAENRTLKGEPAPSPSGKPWLEDYRTWFAIASVVGALILGISL